MLKAARSCLGDHLTYVDFNHPAVTGNENVQKIFFLFHFPLSFFKNKTAFSPFRTRSLNVIGCPMAHRITALRSDPDPVTNA
jgi:hypothetical protein